MSSRQCSILQWFLMMDISTSGVQMIILVSTRIECRFGFKQISKDMTDLRGQVAFSPLRVDPIKLSGVGLETMFR